MKRILSFTLALVLVFSLSAVFGTSAVAVELPEGIVKISDGSPVTKGSVSTVTNADTGLITYVLSDGASVSFTVNAEKTGSYKLEVLGVTVSAKSYPAEAYLRVYDGNGKAVAAGGTTRLAKDSAVDAANGTLTDFGTVNLTAGENTLTVCPPARISSTVSKVGVAAVRLTYIGETDNTEKYFVFMASGTTCTITGTQSSDMTDSHIRLGGEMSFKTPELTAGRYAVSLRMGGKNSSRGVFAEQTVSTVKDSAGIVIPDAVFENNIDNSIDYRITQELLIGEMNFDDGVTDVALRCTKDKESIGIVCQYVVFEKVADAENAKAPSLSIEKEGAALDTLESGEATVVYRANGNQFMRGITLLVVSYDDDGAMIGYETVAVPSGDCDTVTLPFAVSDAVESVMMILVDDVTNMRPYSDAVTVSR